MDTCFVEVVARWSDADHFTRFGGKFECRKARDDREMCVLECMNGTMTHSCLLEWMAKGGVPFYGWHTGVSGSFNAYLFAADGKNYAEIESDAVENFPVIPVDKNGAPSTFGLDRARGYLAVLARAEKIIGVYASWEEEEGAR